MKEYIEELRYFFRSKVYTGSLFAIAIISYWYAAVNTSIGIDDIRGELEIGAGKQVIASGRFSLAFWPYLLGYKTKWIENSFAIDIISIFALMLGVTNCCILFHKILKETMPIMGYTLFSCLMLSYPLIHEIWEYTHINLCICMGYVCASMALLIMYEQLHGKSNKSKPVVASLLMLLVCSGYESVVFVYIFMVFAILFVSILNEYKEKVFRQVLRHGEAYAGILAIGVFLRIFITKVIILGMFHVPLDGNGATAIMWGIKGFREIVGGLINGWINSYLLKGIVYFPLTEFWICIVVYVILFVYVVIKVKEKALCIPGIGMLFSLIALSILQGSVTFYRSCQVFSIFVAFTGMLLYYIIWRKGGKRLVNTVVILLSWVCLVQAIYLSYWLSVNHMRSEEEVHVIRQIGNDLACNYDMQKPIVMLGGYNLSKFITEAVSIDQSDIRWKIYSHVYAWINKEDYEEVYNGNRILNETNVSSVITWALGDQIDIFNLFQICGYDYVFPEDAEICIKAEKYVQESNMPGYPGKGYIEDIGEFIVVYIN